MSGLPVHSYSLGRSHSRTLSMSGGGYSSPTEPQISWTSLKKPTFRRSGSHKVDPFLSIRHILHDIMPPSWKTEEELHILSKNIVAVSSGMFTAHVIEDCPLDRWGLEMFAAELDAVNKVDGITFIFDSKSSRLVIANVKILISRITQYPNSNDTTFLTFGVDQFERIDGSKVHFLVNVLAVLSHSLSNNFSHVIQLGDYDNGPIQTDSQLRTFCDWIRGTPVVYVASSDAGFATGKGMDWEELKLKERRSIKVMLEGAHASNDHVLDLVIPKSLFHLDSLAEPADGPGRRKTSDTAPFEAPLSLSSPSHFTCRDLQDQLQTIMFDRLNSSAVASRLWSDVSVMVEE